MAAHAMDRLTIEYEETDVVVPSEEGEDEDDNIKLCLVGQFLTDGSIRLHVMKERMAGVWRPLGGVAI